MISTFLLLNVKFHTESNGAIIFLKFSLDSLQFLILLELIDWFLQKKKRMSQL